MNNDIDVKQLYRYVKNDIIKYNLVWALLYVHETVSDIYEMNLNPIDSVKNYLRIGVACTDNHSSLSIEDIHGGVNSVALDMSSERVRALYHTFREMVSIFNTHRFEIEYWEDCVAIYMDTLDEENDPILTIPFTKEDDTLGIFEKSDRRRRDTIDVHISKHIVTHRYTVLFDECNHSEIEQQAKFMYDRILPTIHAIQCSPNGVFWAKAKSIAFIQRSGDMAEMRTSHDELKEIASQLYVFIDHFKIKQLAVVVTGFLIEDTIYHTVELDTTIKYDEYVKQMDNVKE